MTCHPYDADQAGIDANERDIEARLHLEEMQRRLVEAKSAPKHPAVIEQHHRDRRGIELRLREEALCESVEATESFWCGVMVARAEDPRWGMPDRGRDGLDRSCWAVDGDVS